MPTARHTFTVITVAALCLAACDSPFASPGSTLSLFITADSLTAGDSTIGVRVLVVEEAGDPVQDKTRVFLFTSLGGFCVDGSASASLPSCKDEVRAALEGQTENGTVDARFRSPSDVGLAIITARSGQSVRTDTVVVIPPPPPELLEGV